MSPKQEILTITELAMEISELTPQKPVHSCSIGATGVSVTVFDEDDKVAWQTNLFEWSHDEAYLPKLRWLRHELEQMKQAALDGRMEEAA